MNFPVTEHLCQLDGPRKESSENLLGYLWRTARRLCANPHGGAIATGTRSVSKVVPRVKLLLHDLSSDELITGLRDASLELAVMVEPIGEQTAGIKAS